MTDAPPPPPAEPLKPIVLPPGSTAGPSGAAPGPGLPNTPYGAEPRGAATRSPLLLGGVALVAFLGLVANSVGMAGFPGNAPVEQIYAFGVGVDLLAIMVVGVVGAILSRRGYPLRSSTPVSTLALVLALISVLAWIVFGGIGSVVELIPPDRGRYMYASGGLFYGGVLWVLAAVFGSHAYRRGGTARNNGLAIAALAIVGALAAYAIASSLLYGAGITD